MLTVKNCGKKKSKNNNKTYKQVNDLFVERRKHVNAAFVECGNVFDDF